MPPFSIFETINLNTAEELIHKLIPNEEELLWNNDKQEYHLPWIFRGQKDADWDLNPSAMRTGNLYRYIPAQAKPPPLTIERQLDLEEHLVAKFATGVDQQGLEVPGDMPELRDKDLAPKKNELLDFPRLKYRPMYALAQHYGIPTRLLDWTRDPLVAAYFACCDIARQKSDPSKHRNLQCDEILPDRFAIWALSERFTDIVARHWDLGFIIITVPTCSNPNLCAQKGLFTLVRYKQSAPNHKDKLLPPELHLPSIYKIIQDIKTPPILSSNPGYEYNSTILYKFTLPAKEARTLLRLLSLHGVSAASVFPGHKGVADAMFEENWHQRAKPEERS